MLIINAEKRQEKGKSFSRRIRTKNQFPGILYGLDKSSILLILDHNSIFNLQKKIEFYKENLCLLIKEEKHIVRVQSVQRHSFKLKLLHMDFIYIK